MAGKISAHGAWFCSIHCVRQFEKEKALSPLKEEILRAVEKKSVYSYPVFWVSLTIVFILVLSQFIFYLSDFPNYFWIYFKKIWFPLVLGFLIGGFIEVYIPRSYISKSLAGSSFKTILRAVFLGFIFSGCSHGCLAIALELYKKGASPSAVISFLLASPWANISITLLLFSFFGTKGILIVLGAFVVSFFTGSLFAFLSKKGMVEKNFNSLDFLDQFSIKKDIQSRWENYHFHATVFIKQDFPKIFIGAFHLSQMVLWWVLLGMTLASLAGVLIPATFFHNWMGKSFLGMGVTLGFATILEVCSEGTAPLAFEIYRQTHAFGNTFLFLMAGVITDYTEIGLLWTNIGWRTALFLPIIAVPATLLIATLFNFF
ncbi:MAG: permease [Elusimicrobia bacterium]|nr:permease [Elusimicrobiota bacterium]